LNLASITHVDYSFKKSSIKPSSCSVAVGHCASELS
jgi:hypothetical protein